MGFLYNNIRQVPSEMLKNWGRSAQLLNVSLWGPGES